MSELTLAEILKTLGETKVNANEAYKTYKVYKEVEDNLKAELMFKLKDTGLKSAKGDAFTASITEKPTVVVKSEIDVIEWLKNNPEIESDFYIGLKKAEFGLMANAQLKDTGEVPNGCDVEVRESLAIRANKKG